MNICRVCERRKVQNLLDFGWQPVCGRFLKSPAEEEYMHPLVIGQCEACGLIQVIDPVPPAKLKPVYSWLTYTEPERHLSHLADMIIGLPGVTEESIICGISFKDDSILSLLKERGFKNTWRVDPKSDLRIDDVIVGLATVHARFNPEIIPKITRSYGQPDVVIARHFLEHSNSFTEFMRFLKKLVKPQGYIIIEVPDCERAIEKCDYTTIWEEHILYFTSETFRTCFSFGGFSPFRFESFAYALENSLVGIGRLDQAAVSPFPNKDILENEQRRMLAFSSSLDEQRERFKKFLSDYQKDQGKIAMFGAGHLACAFLNLLELKDFIKFIADDSPQKQGLFMPGSHIPIYKSRALLEKNIKLCLLSLTPDKEETVIQNNKSFLENKGNFYSIFPGSECFLHI